MKVIGITGGIASGKSSVARILQGLGVTVLDADVLAHQALEPGTASYQAVVREFGPTILNPQGEVDREQLGRIVFQDPQARKNLEALIHPGVIAAIKREIEACRRAGRAVLAVEVPLLFEVGLTELFNSIWVVYATTAQQLQRLQELKGLSLAAAQDRLAAQLPLTEKAARADRVIDNTRGFTELQGEVETALEELKG